MTPGSAAQPLLLKVASEDMSSSELLFSPLPGQDHSKEADAWQVSTASALHSHWLCFVARLHYTAHVALHANNSALLLTVIIEQALTDPLQVEH